MFTLLMPLTFSRNCYVTSSYMTHFVTGLCVPKSPEDPSWIRRNDSVLGNLHFLGFWDLGLARPLL